jgi:hypothetical protein
MKIIFLDIDGPMVTRQCNSMSKWGRFRFDLKSVAVLNYILLETGAEIVLSSDWRNDFTLSEMRDIFADSGVIRAPFSYTPNSRTYTGDNLEGGRVDEIKAWLKMYAWKDDTKWVAIDDLKMTELDPNFVWISNDNEGIKKTGLKELIIDILK